jgi:drug/metabolite transporter (DMT)-like permease
MYYIYRFMKKKQIAILVTVVEALLFVILSVTVRMMGKSFSIPQQMFIRLLGAFLLSVIIFYPKINRINITKITSKEWFIYVLRSFIYYGLGVTLITYALLHTTLGVVSFASSLPIMGLLGYLYFKEKFDLKIIPVILFSVIGLGLLSRFNFTDFRPNMGMLAALASLVLFDTAFLMVRLHNKKYSNYQNTVIVLAFSWIIPLLTLIYQHKNIWPSSVSVEAYIGLFVSIVLNIANLFLLNFIFTNLKAFLAGNILLLEGVFALIIGYIFFNEKVDLIQMIGVLIILSSAVGVAYLEEKNSNN